MRVPGGRLGLRALAPALVLLGVCVFAWGLRYKLSFYARPHSVTHRMAEAKLLLTDRSSVPAVVLRKAADSIAPLATPVVFVPALLLLAGMNLWFGHEWALERGRVHRSPQWFRGSSAFIRPPPCD
jgi:NhaP-type Na+/H+ or K+/H+ antiporter